MRPMSPIFCSSALVLLSVPCVAVADEPTTAEFFAPARVHDIRITLPDDDWQELCSESRNMPGALRLQPSSSPYHYFKAKMVIDGVPVKSVGVRKKGFLGSQDAVRPSLKVSFSKYHKKQRFAGLEKLTLNNNKQDRALLSQYLTYESFRRVGLAAPRINFAHVWVNGKDLGVYSNVESAGATVLKHNFGDAAGALYEGTVVDFIPDRISRFERKNGRDRDSDRQQLARIAALLETPETDLEALERDVDIDSFLKFWAMESLIGFWDGYGGNQNNYFIYSHPKDGRIRFMPWGADVAFGKGLIAAIFKAGRPESVAAWAWLPNRLYQIESMRTRYFETLDKLLDEFWDEERLIAETRRIEELLAPHVCDEQQDHRRAAEGMRRFIVARRAELQKERSDGPPEVKFNRRKTVCTRPRGSITGTFSTHWRAEKPGTTELQLVVDGQPVELTEVRVTATRGGGSPMMGLGPNSPQIRISAARADNQKPVVVTIMVHELAFRAGHKYPATAHGGYSEGESGFFRRPLSLPIAGTVRFDQAGREQDDPVCGSFSLELLEMDEGHPPRESAAESSTADAE